MSDRLTRQQVDDFLDRHKDPADARRFLQEAGLIDENGELTAPYRLEKPQAQYAEQPEPTDEELDEVWDEEAEYFALYAEAERFGRAVLARWGNR